MKSGSAKAKTPSRRKARAAGSPTRKRAASAGGPRQAAVEQALEEIRAGRMVIVVDDEERENEGDLIMAASKTQAADVNFMVREARGLLCVALSPDRAEALDLFPMTPESTALHGTAFTVSVDATTGVTTGSSAQDRALTIRRLADPAARPGDFARPGHVFPLRAVRGGVLRRAGHTEAALDLVRLAGLGDVGVLCEMMAPDGTMARLPQLRRFGVRHGLRILAIQDLIAYRRRKEKLVRHLVSTRLPTPEGVFDLHLYESLLDGDHHLALTMGDVSTPAPVLVRVHSQCLTGDVFGSQRCDCGGQMHAALRAIAKEGRGVFLYMRQEGRGIGLANKLRAYVLQDQGYDTVQANLKLGFPADLRDYGIGAQILHDLGVRRIELMTNNPRKIVGLEAFGLSIVKRRAIQMPANANNRRYLATKRDKLGHLLELGSGEAR
ncbi:MAG: bifunctional 3,4-dihydroxy-2-butanone-4-phosphate synthase/GTP cyclohydrolase II [Candidatus Eiseniibacteriota bacterium]